MCYPISFVFRSDDVRWHVETVKKLQAIQSTLIVINVELRDSGHYYCRVNKINKKKFVEENATIHVQCKFLINV